MSTTIYLVRHGETDANASLTWQGQLDTELNLTGRAQAAAVARRLEHVPFTAVYTSDLKRALVTAEAIAARHGLPVRLAPGLREIHLGRWQGLQYSAARELDPEAHAALMADPVNTRRPGGGESWADLERRVTIAFNEIAAANLDETICVVGHGGTLRALLAEALGLSFASARRLATDNTSVSVLVGEPDDWRLTLFNDVHHLSASHDEGKWPD
jgi:broad specificity phosphatase PhoE